jgi:hypothetical protein
MARSASSAYEIASPSTVKITGTIRIDSIARRAASLSVASSEAELT